MLHRPSLQNERAFDADILFCGGWGSEYSKTQRMFPRTLISNGVALLLAGLGLVFAGPLFGAEVWWEQAAGTVKSVPGWVATDAAGKPAKLEMRPGAGGTVLIAESRPIKLTAP